MPPPISPQGSRAGLITAVVVLSILFVTSTIFAFYYNAELGRTEDARSQLEKTNLQFASNEYQQDPAFQEVMAMLGEPEYSGQSAAQVLITQRNAANNRLAGVTPPAAAETKYLAAMGQATDPSVAEAGVTTITKGSNLADVVTQLVTGLKEQAAQVSTAKEQLAAAQKEYQDTVEQRKVELGARDAKITEQGQQLEAALAELAARGEAGDQSVEKVRAEAARALQAAQKVQSAQQKQIAETKTQMAAVQRQLEIATQRLKELRPVGTKENPVRQEDAEVVRVPGNGTVYINIGSGQQVSPGLTFEVYDRISGVPAIGPSGTSDEGTLPQGKASIEVVRPGPGQSECRIIRVTPGQSIVERDVVANLVYNQKVKHNFVVFGDFDLDQNKIATPGDAEVIKRLITGWGGQLQDAVNVNTDFVVLGAEPEVPVVEDDATASDLQRQQAAQKALDAYDEVRSAATKLNIPIMNQNRFLYYVGYYERAQR